MWEVLESSLDGDKSLPIEKNKKFCLKFSIELDQI